MTAEEIINTLHNWQDKLQNSHIEDFSEDSVFCQKIRIKLRTSFKRNINFIGSRQTSYPKVFGSFSKVLIACYESLKQYIDSIQEKIKHHQTHLKGLKTYHSHIPKSNLYGYKYLSCSWKSCFLGLFSWGMHVIAQQKSLVKIRKTS